MHPSPRTRCRSTAGACGSRARQHPAGALLLRAGCGRRRSLLAISCLAYCRAREGRGWREAGELCREALRREPGHPLHHLMLGRICLLAGEKEQAVIAFRTGLSFGYHPALIRELERMGVRQKPFFRFLDRRHLLNRCCGLLFTRMGVRPLLHSPPLSSWQA